MKVAKFMRDGQSAAGIVDGDEVRIVEAWQEGPPEWHRFVLPSMTVAQLQDLPVREVVLLNGLAYATPIDAGTKVVCIGINYRAHAGEAGRDVAPQPSLFLRTFDSLQPHGEVLVRTRHSERFDFEGEIAVVLGKSGRDIATNDAMDHVFGYTCLMDGSVRDYQQHSVTAGKNFCASGAVGPWIATADELPDWRRLTLTTRLNGAEVQHATADTMIHTIPDLIAYVSRWAHLQPGDIIATGTPSGVGLARTPPLWMKHGDRIEVSIEGVGTLANDVRDQP